MNIVNIALNDIKPLPTADLLGREARRVLRRLAEPGACLAVADGMPKAVVVREGGDGQTVRTGVVDCEIAEIMALNDWIEAGGTGRVMRYRITAAGRAILREYEGLDGSSDDGDGSRPDTAAGPGRIRYSSAESPLAALARRRDRDGTPFLSDVLIAAGERLREEFELAEMSDSPAPAWDTCIAPDAELAAPDGLATGPDAARARVAAALADLGPGLGDVVLRTCCHLEGMETVERRMGWAARSGKIVLRIALQRLRRHYEDGGRDYGAMMG